MAFPKMRILDTSSRKEGRMGGREGRGQGEEGTKKRGAPWE